MREFDYLVERDGKSIHISKIPFIELKDDDEVLLLLSYISECDSDLVDKWIAGMDYISKDSALEYVCENHDPSW